MAPARCGGITLITSARTSSKSSLIVEPAISTSASSLFGRYST
jgi:hypothetical protein